MNVFLKMLIVLSSLCLSLLPVTLSAGGAKYPKAAQEQLVVVVRHAEKALDQGDDPQLTEMGEARARALHSALAQMQVGAVFITQWQRTRATAAPLAKALNLEPIVVATQGSDAQAHVREVADSVRAQAAKVVLVVGHSNTVPAIVAALGGPTVEALGDNDYDHLYLLWRSAGKVHLLHARY